MRVLVLLCFCSLLCTIAGPAFAAQEYYEDWDALDDLAGWIPNTVDADVVHMNAGGNPNGYIQSFRIDPGIFPIGATTNLADAGGDWAAAGIFEVSFDVDFQEGDFTQAMFRARYQDSANNGWHFVFTGDFTPGWRSYVINIDPAWTDAEAIAAGWVQDAGSLHDFATTFSDVYHPEVRIDGTSEILVAGIDNFRLRACPERTIILSADFNADTPASPPDTTLPGDPDCDSLEVISPSATVTVEAAVGSLTDQPLFLDQVPGIGSARINFYPCATRCDLVRVGWNSLSRSYDNFFLACVLRDASGLILGSLEYRPGGVLTYNGVIPVPVSYVVDQDQRFEIQVDASAATTSLIIDGVAVPGLQGVPYYQAAAGALARFAFEPGGTDAQQFAFDNVVITSCCACDIDTTAPEFSVSMEPDVLWPPNHKLIEVCPVVDIEDNCDASPVVTFMDAWSSEPDNGHGDGDTTDDIQEGEDGCLLLRAERRGGGDGRTYYIAYCATDASGNTVCDTAEVVVPHDQSGNAAPVAGFTQSGTAVVGDASFVILAARLNPGETAESRAWAQSDLGLIKAVDTAFRDVDGDGQDELLMTFSGDAVRSLIPAVDETDLAGPDGSVRVGDLKALDPGTVMLRYEVGGEGYLVDDIFALGEMQGIDNIDSWRDDTPVDAGSLTLAAGGRIELALPVSGHATVQVFDVRGRRVRTLVDADLAAGLHGYAWDGRRDDGQALSNGIYFVRGRGPGVEAVLKVSVIR